VVRLAAQQPLRPAGHPPAARDHPEHVLTRVVPERQLRRPALRVRELEPAAPDGGVGLDHPVRERDLLGREQAALEEIAVRLEGRVIRVVEMGEAAHDRRHLRPCCGLC
jgi:hypothetical protein